jgi:hypothetical protein
LVYSATKSTTTKSATKSVCVTGIFVSVHQRSTSAACLSHWWYACGTLWTNTSTYSGMYDYF